MRRIIQISSILILPALCSAQVWVARYDGQANSFDDAYAIVVDAAGNGYITGRSSGLGTEYDHATVMCNAAGIEQWVEHYNGPAHDDDFVHAITVDNAGNRYVTGGSYAWSTGFDYATIKYTAAGVDEQNTVALQKEGIVSTIFSGPLVLPEDKTYRILDIAGRVNTPDNLKSGIYFPEIDGEIAQKVIKIK